MNKIFIALALGGVLLPVLAPGNNRRVERRFFWLGFLVSVPSAFFISYPPSWKAGIGLSALATILMLTNAYFSTSNIKIRGKIYAFNVSNTLPDPSSDGPPYVGGENPDYDPAPDSYGGVATAQKFWWLLIFMMIICIPAVFVQAEDKPWWLAPVMGTIAVVMPFFVGYSDASWDYPIARGQRTQLVILSLGTAGLFVIVYLAAYCAGKRWPVRRKQDMEYRAHPRHQKRYP